MEPDHTAEQAWLLRRNHAVDHHTESLLPDLAADLVGPDVKFRESTINFKRAGCGAEVR